MKAWFFKCGEYEQVIKSDATWSCTCPHGSIGRFKKGQNFPCIHAVIAYRRWATMILNGRKRIEISKV